MARRGVIVALVLMVVVVVLVVVFGGRIEALLLRMHGVHPGP